MHRNVEGVGFTCTSWRDDEGVRPRAVSRCRFDPVHQVVEGRHPSDRCSVELGSCQGRRCKGRVHGHRLIDRHARCTSVEANRSVLPLRTK